MQTGVSYGILASLLRALALAAGLAFVAPPIAAQPGVPSLDGLGGSYYLIAFPDTVTNKIDIRYPNTRVSSEASIWIFSAVKNKVKIKLFGGASTTLTIEAGKFKEYRIPGSAVVDEINIPVQKSIALESDYPVIIYCYFAHIQGLEAWTPLPVELWGKSYRAAASPGEVVADVGIAGETEIPETPKPAPAEILVIAAYNNTSVTLTPPSGIELKGNPSSVVMLQAGECYQVQSEVTLFDNASQDDIGATKIVADKPIAVLSGNTRAQFNRQGIGLKNNVYKNLVIEWLRPEEQYGREFVYMPTWDNHRPETGVGAVRSREYIRLYPKDSTTLHGAYTARDSGSQTIRKVEFQVEPDTVRELGFSPHAAIHFTTDRPAQVMMHSSAIIQFNGSTPCFRGIPCLSYSAWAPYMVELTPREQWTSFAPYIAPVNPGGMQHYINVVTDSGSAKKIVREDGRTFPFNNTVPGTGLVWGSVSVSQGESHWLVGIDGARFAGYLYGIFSGGEEYRPGRTRKKERDATPAGGRGANPPAPLHPAEYEEYNALSYGYPLVAEAKVLRAADSVVIDTIRDCSRVTINARAINADPTGFRSVTIDQESVRNAKLTPIAPSDLADVVGRSAIVVRVSPIDSSRDASAVVIIRSRTGDVWRIPITIGASVPAFPNGKEIHFDSASYNVPTDQVVTLTNPHGSPVTVRSVDMAIKGQGFTITGTNPDGPARPAPTPVVLAPGESMAITLRLHATIPGSFKAYRDSLVIRTECARTALPVSSLVSEPEIVVNDLDFGTMTETAAPRTLWLEVCNDAAGWIEFNSSSGSTPVEWSNGAFTIPDSAIARLRNARIGSGICDSIPVTFTPQGRGEYQTRARFWGTTRFSRDTSIWRATVTGEPLAVPGHPLSTNGLQISTLGSAAMIRSALAAPGDLTIEIYDALGRLIVRVADGYHEAGERLYTWDGAGYPRGIYYCRMSVGSWRRTAPVTLK